MLHRILPASIYAVTLAAFYFIAIIPVVTHAGLKSEDLIELGGRVLISGLIGIPAIIFIPKTVVVLPIAFLSVYLWVGTTILRINACSNWFDNSCATTELAWYGRWLSLTTTGLILLIGSGYLSYRWERKIY